MIKRYNFSVDAWLEVEIDGDSVEDCDEQLREAELEDLAKSGWVRDFDIKDLDEAIIDEWVSAKITNIKYREDDEEKLADLPTEYNIEVNVTGDNIDEIDIKDALMDGLEDELDTKIEDFDYEVEEIS